MKGKTIKTAYELWERLEREAGLELVRSNGAQGRDTDLEAEVLRRLQSHVSLPRPARSVKNLLLEDAKAGAPAITAELLLLTILESMKGFAPMMTQILETLVLAQATVPKQSLSIEFKFDTRGGDPTLYTLRQFRQQVTTVGRTLESRLVLPSSEELHALRRTLQDLGGKNWMAAADFPPQKTFSSSGDRHLDSMLAEVHALIADFRSWCLQFGSTREEVEKAVRSRYPNNNVPPGLEGWRLAGLARDHWDMAASAALASVAAKAATGTLDRDHATAALTTALKHFKREKRWVDRTFNKLLDLLDLPTWRKRHELYSVWVGTVLLRTANRYANKLQFHPVNGVLSFTFNSQLATYQVQGHQYEIWAELRSALVGASTKRKQGIQPDFRVICPSLGGSVGNTTKFVLECKHYLTQGTANFLGAAKDYARSCGGAQVFVVNHGPTDEVTLKAECEKVAPGQVSFFGDTTVEREIASQRLNAAIQRVLFPPSAHTALSTRPAFQPASMSGGSAFVATIKVRWDDSLHDIDLSLLMHLPNQTGAAQVGYFDPGHLLRAPFAALEKDVSGGPGEEIIRISAWNYCEYVILVQNFTRDIGRLGAGNVRCEIDIGGRPTEIECPDLGGDSVWQVGRIDCTGGTPRLRLDPP